MQYYGDDLEWFHYVTGYRSREELCRSLETISLFELATLLFKTNILLTAREYPIVSKRKFRELFSLLSKKSPDYSFALRMQKILNFQLDVNLSIRKARVFNDANQSYIELQTKIADAILDCENQEAMDLWDKLEELNTLADLETAADRLKCTFVFYPCQLFTEYERTHFLYLLRQSGLGNVGEKEHFAAIGSREY